MPNLEGARKFLLDLERNDLALLLKGGSYTCDDAMADWGPVRCISLRVHPLIEAAINGLSQNEKLRILEAIAEEESGLQDVRLDPDTLLAYSDRNVRIESGQDLLAELICQRNLMISVATGGPRINEVNDYYRARRKRIARLLETRSLQETNSFNDLWEWYKYWSQNLGSYAERREYVASLYDRLIALIAGTPPSPVPVREPTGWERVDRAIEKARIRFEAANSEEDYQSVGLLCREALISLGQAVHDPEKHPSPDGVLPSSTDAKRLIDAFLAAIVTGESNESIRRHAKAALALALDLQHRRTADYRLAAMCLEATSSTINIVAILGGAKSGADRAS